MNGQPDIIVGVRFYATDAGGRNGPTPTDVFRCLFEFEGKMFDCGLLLKDIGSLAPGTTAKMPIVFFCPKLIKPRLKVGSPFTLWEMRTIADGIVEQILSD